MSALLLLPRPASSPSSAGPQLQAQDHGGPRRTSTASPRSQWSLPDPNSKPRIRVVPAGPQHKPRIRVVPAGPQLQALD